MRVGDSTPRDRPRAAWLRRALCLAAWCSLGCLPRLPAAVAPSPAPASSTPLAPTHSVLDGDRRLLIHADAREGGRLPLAVVDLEAGASPGRFDEHAWHPDDRTALALAPGTGVVASLRGRADEILVWEPRARQLLGRVRSERGADIVGFAFSADERSLLVATADGLARHAVPDGRRIERWAVPGLRAFAALPGRPGSWIVAVEGTRRRLYRVVDPRGRTWLRRVPERHYAVLDERGRTRRLDIPGQYGVELLRVSPDGRWLAVSAWGPGATDELQIWDLIAGRELAIGDSDGPVTALEFSADGRVLVASRGLPCVNPRTPHLTAWDLERRRVLLDARGEPADILGVRRDRVIVREVDAVIELDLRSGHRAIVLPSKCGPVCRVRLCA